jgi:hypothetical protein
LKLIARVMMRPSLVVLHPVLAIAAAQNHLHHRCVARECEGFGVVNGRRRERGSVQHQRDIMLRAQLLQDLAAHGVFERSQCNRQWIEALRFECLDQGIEYRGIGGLQMRLIEQDRHDRRVGVPACLPVGDRRCVVVRVIKRGRRQHARWRRLTPPTERTVSNATQKRLGILRTAFTQVAP